VTHDELLEKIDTLEARYTDYPSYLALRAVVELHQPAWTFPEGSNNSIPICLQCRHTEFPADYPCPTIQAIEKELG